MFPYVSQHTLNDYQANSRATPPGTAEAGGQQFGFQTVLAALRCWWKVATPLGLLFAAAAGFGVYYFWEPTYTGEVWLQIHDRRLSPLEGVLQYDPQKFVANQMEIMKSPPIINPVAAIPAVVKTPEIAKELDPVVALKSLVKIVPKGRSEFFVVQFTSTRRESAALIPNAIAKAYIEMQQRTDGARMSDLVKLLNDELTQLDAVVTQARTSWYGEYTNALGIAPDEVQSGPQGSPVVQVPPVEKAIESELIKAEVDRMMLEVELKYLQSQAVPEPTPWEIDQLVLAQPAVQRLQMSLEALQPKIDDFKSRSANPAGNKLLRDAESQQKQLEDQLEKVQADFRSQAKTELTKANQSKREAELLKLENKRESLNLLVSALGEKSKKQVEEVASNQTRKREVKDKLFKVEMLKRDYERAQERRDELKKRLDNIALEQRSLAQVEIYQLATEPAIADEKLPYKKIVMAALAAFCIPFGLAVGAELLFRRVSDRQQLEKASDIPVVAEVTTLPRIVRTSAQSEKPNRELQLYEECIDGLRTYLTLVHSLQGMQVLAVASSVSREGKTSLAAQLAVSLASATGELTLLIDGDTRSPDVHRIFGVDQGPGLVEVLQGEISVEEAIETGFNDKLHLLTAGTLKTSPHRLVGDGNFLRLVERVKDIYRYVIIDTPPILPAAEALVMARAADTTVLCVRRDHSRVDQVKEAYSRLRAAGVKTAGAVLNGIPTRSYTYRYDSYYYTRSRFQPSGVEVNDA